MGHNHIMKVFALVALVPLVACGPAVPFTAFGGHAVHHAAPAVHHAVHAPAVHHAVHAPVVHHAVHAAPVIAHHAPVAHHAVHHAAPVYHKPHYGYEQPKHNCSVQDVVET